MTSRLDRLRAMLQEYDLDAVLVSSPANRFYLSGFLSDDDGGQTTAALLVGANVATLMTGATNLGWAHGSARDVDVLEWKRPWPRFVAERIREAGWSRVGFEDSSMTVAAFRSLREEVGPAVLFAPFGSRVDRLRRTKDGTEQAAMAGVLALTDRAFDRAIAELAVGITERELAWRIDRALREEGASGSAFPTIVASGPNASRPHHAPSDRPIQEGEPVIVDMGAKLGGYNGDLTRTVWLGQADPRLTEIVGVVSEAHSVAWNAVRAGAQAKDVHDAAESVAAAAGSEDHYLHGTGHGLGIEVHEAPSCGTATEDILQEGDVLTIEPGIYLAGWGGVRIEDVGIVREDGFHRLTRAVRQRP